MLSPLALTVITPKINIKQFQKSRSHTQRRLKSQINAKVVGKSIALLAEQETIFFYALQVVEGLLIDPVISIEDKIIKAAKLHA